MKLTTYLGTSIVAAILIGVLSGTGVAAPKNVGHVTADVYVQVVRRPTLVDPWARFGVAHITVRAADFDSSQPSGLESQPDDQVSVSCEPVASPQCIYVAQTNFLWVQLTETGEAFIASDRLMMRLHDGGNPGNRPTGVTSGSGDVETTDFLTLDDWFGFATFDAWVISGKLKIQS